MGAPSSRLSGVSPPFDAVILIAHGARDARWMEPFQKMQAELARALAPQKVALAFLEFAKPDFAEAVADVCASGARTILVAPIFLSGGGHVAHDVPRLVATARERHPEATFAVSGAIGEEREVAAGMMDAVTRLAKG
jgi:sirohydrochlorin cobaltochelatase